MAKNDEKTPHTEEEQVLETQGENQDDQGAADKNQAQIPDELEKLKQDLAVAKDKYLRLYAEFDNFRKRTSKEKLELRKYAAQDTLAALLPVLDDFDRAKRNHDDSNSTEEFSEGVMFVYEKISQFAKGQGLEAINATGETFNVDFHEAITEIPAPTEDLKGKVIDTVENGYKLHDKIIRYAKVVVGK